MGDRRDDDRWADLGFGSTYLTPGQELHEAYSAPRRIIEASEWNNPLAQREAAVLANMRAREAGATSVAPASVVPNPLVQPPAPLATMPVAQQMAWRQYQATALKQQGDQAKSDLDQRITERTEKQRVEALRQAQQLMDRTIELDPTDKNYPLQRAKLARDHPLGAMTAEGQRAFEHFDRQYQQRTELETQYMKADENARRTGERSLFDAARKQAQDLGPEAHARFIETAKSDPDAAINEVTQTAGALKQAEYATQLQQGGMRPEEIATTFGGGETGRPFQYGAAEATIKRQITPAQEVRENRAMLTTLAKQRTDARYRPGEKPNPMWSEDEEKVYQDVLRDYNAGMNRGNGNRAGVGGMPTAVVTPPAPAPALAQASAPRKSYYNPTTKQSLTYVLQNGKWVIE